MSGAADILDWFFAAPVTGGSAAVSLPPPLDSVLSDGKKSASLPALRVKTAPAADEPLRLPRLRGLRDYVEKLRRFEPERPEWSDDWWDLPDDAGASRCRAMFATALFHLLREALDERIRDLSADARCAPESWIGSRDFHLLCDLAGIEAGPAIVAEVERCSASSAALRELRERLTYISMG